MKTGRHADTSKYLVEFRFHGLAKKKIREYREIISRKFGANMKRRKEVPHITLAGPCYTKDGKRLIREVHDVVRKFDIVPFSLDGFGRFDERAICVKVVPSDEMIKMRNEIVKRLDKFCRLRDHDYKPEFKAHATLCMNAHFPGNVNMERKFDDIMEFLGSWKMPKFRQNILRVTILGGNGKIVCEYDLMLKKMLNRREALGRGLLKDTIAILKDKREMMFPIRHHTEPIDETDFPGRVFVVSDLHFDHKNIIRYCKRPFRDEHKMNRAMLNNWNKTVKDGDRVYYLGDLTFGRGQHTIDYWLSKMNGQIRFIRGNHDTDIIKNAKVIKDRFPIMYRNYKFLLMHDPYRPPDYHGWIIHGDKHNSRPYMFPHINRRNRTINVCAEFTNYTPMNLDEIVKNIKRRY